MPATGLTSVSRLVVSPDSPEAWDVLLHQGTNTLGRGDGNDCPIRHASVSTVHCQIVISNSGAWIKDLGSTNGTFVEGKPVKESLLVPGQTIQLGSVGMRFECSSAQGEVRPVHGPPVVRSAPVPLAPAMPESPASAFCKFHPGVLARFACRQCGRTFCEVCVNTRQVGGKRCITCRTCGVDCAPLEVKPVSFGAELPAFPRLAASAFSYPLKGDGVVLLVAGTIFYWLLNLTSFFAGFALFYGVVALIFLAVFGTGYLTSYLRRILTSSAMGETRMPDWPDFSDFGSDILAPFFQLVGTVLACFVPAILIALFVKPDLEWRSWALLAAYAFGCVYFPMAFLGVAMFDTIAAVNPLLVMPAIVKVLKEYALTVFLLLALLLVRWATQVLASLPMSPAVRLAYSAVASFAGLYLLTVEVRLLGLLYFAKKDELGWFNH